jgi:hypothetical protein
MAGRRTGLLAPGNRSAAPSRGLRVAPSGRRPKAPAASFTPVTVAGPRRLRTGLPLTTDRIYASESIRRSRPRAGRLTFATHPEPKFPPWRTTRAMARPSVGCMVPRVATPIPAAIGVGTVFDIATASGIVCLALATVFRADQQKGAANGARFGLVFGVVVYLTSLLT